PTSPPRETLPTYAPRGNRERRALSSRPCVRLVSGSRQTSTRTPARKSSSSGPPADVATPGSNLGVRLQPLSGNPKGARANATAVPNTPNPRIHTVNSLFENHRRRRPPP